MRRGARRWGGAPLVATAAIALVLALWGGLARIGWVIPVTPELPGAHGPLMLVGVLGTIIAVERAVALDRAWGFVAPLGTAAAAVSLVVGAPARTSAILASGGAVALVLVLAALWRRERAAPTAVLVLGAILFAVGTVGWALGWPMFEVVPWWTTWIVLTIAGERLELSRVLAPSRAARVAFSVVCALLVAGLAASPRLRGGATLGLAAWLLSFDVARRTVRLRALPRFVAVNLILGYAWLGVAGALVLSEGDVAVGPMYDAATHALLVGFAFSMIFAHAPVIFPAVVGIAIPYRPTFYAHTALLHVGLVLRLAGDLAPHGEARRWGSMANALAIVAFIAATATAAATNVMRSRPRRS